MKTLLRALAVASALLTVPASFAHAPSLSRLTLDARADRLEVTVHLTPPDRDSDGQISAEEYASARAFLRENATHWIALNSGDAPVAFPAGEFTESFEQRTLSWKTSAASLRDGPCDLTLPVLARLGEGHREYVQVLREGAPVTEGLLSAAEPSLAFRLGAATNDASAVTPTSESAGRVARAVGFFKLGVEHIITGYDHLLFLAGLILVCRKLRDLLAVVTSFTLAHSVTLGLSALGGVQLPPALVEPLIAASIIVVGIENLVLRGAEPRRRWMPAFAFGLIHGFGFAGALRESGFGDGAASWLSLATFNLGVEAGQLALVALALPLLVWARRQPKVETPLMQCASALVVAGGTFWFAQRLGA